MPKGFFESLFDSSDSDKGKKDKSRDPSFKFGWFNVEPARPFQKSKKAQARPQGSGGLLI